jgi:hypothetical protein
MSKILKAALSYLELGWNVIPLRPDGRNAKRPYIEWLQYQKERVEPYEVEGWWLTWPKANVGILTGSISNLLVFDLDTPAAKEHMKSQGVPVTPMAQTSKGAHVYFKYPSILVGNKSDQKIGIDIRGEGGYVVAPPSIHETGFKYEWFPWHPWNTELSDLYPWMIEYCQASGSSEPRERGWQTDMLQGISKGGRNHACASLAGRFLNKDLSAPEIIELLLMWNERNTPPMSEAEVIRTVTSMAAKHNRRER